MVGSLILPGVGQAVGWEGQAGGSRVSLASCYATGINLQSCKIKCPGDMLYNDMHTVNKTILYT